MEVIAVSVGTPKFHNVNGMKLYTSIVHDEALTDPSEYIELTTTTYKGEGKEGGGILGNKPAVHDGPVYVCFEEHYDYWCHELPGVKREDWGWCHWGENMTRK